MCKARVMTVTRSMLLRDFTFYRQGDKLSWPLFLLQILCPDVQYDICNRTRHLRFHWPDKQHLCSDCGKSFTGNNTLRYHCFIHSRSKTQTSLVVNKTRISHSRFIYYNVTSSSRFAWRDSVCCLVVSCPCFWSTQLPDKYGKSCADWLSEWWRHTPVNQWYLDQKRAKNDWSRAITWLLQIWQAVLNGQMCSDCGKSSIH